ncbi:hypothetical protein EVAR_60519_1 [Eumeta japonica]|uniref:Uncharacterized protein n=1 Tax=Eumeta variegata TaxID=151549 RepID=A0A4C1ZFV1_EUMVA|nr:hypothetical protein EVAR_60519_1 [Eumeta japonica]
MWYQYEDEEDEDLLCSPAILARRASESWINVPPAEIIKILSLIENYTVPDLYSPYFVLIPAVRLSFVYLETMIGCDITATRKGSRKEDSGLGSKIENGKGIESECGNRIRIKRATDIEIRNSSRTRIKSGNKQIVNAQTPLQRKKSLPDVASMPRMTDGGGMSREEVSMLGSARREEVRRMHEESEKLRANPLLYLVSPQVKVMPLTEHDLFVFQESIHQGYALFPQEWFSRQQLVILVLFINISLGIMFFKLLT